MPGKIQDVAHSRRPKRIDRLRIVSDNREAVSLRLESEQYRSLKAVGVLILIHQDMIEAGRKILRNWTLDCHLSPVEQEIVIIEHVLTLFCFDVGAKEIAKFCFPLDAPGKMRT